jgi:hypothetical protein
MLDDVSWFSRKWSEAGLSKRVFRASRGDFQGIGKSIESDERTEDDR